MRDGRIASIGADGGAAEDVDLDGRIVMPGLWDQHVHLTQWALVRRRLDVSGATSAAQAVALVRHRLATDGDPADLVVLDDDPVALAATPGRCGERGSRAP